MPAVSSFDDPLRNVASVPNCTLTSERQSGVYSGSSQPQMAQILEYAISQTLGLNAETNVYIPIDLIVHGNLMLPKATASPQKKEHLPVIAKIGKKADESRASRVCR